jgi:hypothetical protein
MYLIIKKFLFLFDPEKAHHIAMFGLRVANTFGLLRLLPQVPKCKSRVLFNITFENPVGLAAGLDKNAELEPLHRYLNQGIQSLDPFGLPKRRESSIDLGLIM